MKIKFLQPQVRTGSDTVLHLKLYEGTAFDYSLNNHSGTLQATSAYTYPGCDFDGDSDYIEVADHADFSPILSPFSISVWVNMIDSQNFNILSKHAVSKREWIFIVDVNKRFIFYIYDESANAAIGQYSNVTLASYEGTWVHLVGVYDGGTTTSAAKLYCNGNLQASTAFSSNTFAAIENLAQAVWIGRYSTTYADGKVDDVIIYNKELSAAEVKNIYSTSRWRYSV